MLMERQLKIGGKYRHFKGKEYRVLYLARHSETEEALVVYQQLYGEYAVWVRPLPMFLGTTLLENGPVNRFEEIID